MKFSKSTPHCLFRQPHSAILRREYGRPLQVFRQYCGSPLNVTHLTLLQLMTSADLLWTYIIYGYNARFLLCCVFILAQLCLVSRIEARVVLATCRHCWAAALSNGFFQPHGICAVNSMQPKFSLHVGWFDISWHSHQDVWWIASWCYEAPQVRWTWHQGLGWFSPSCFATAGCHASFVVHNFFW